MFRMQRLDLLYPTRHVYSVRGAESLSGLKQTQISFFIIML